MPLYAKRADFHTVENAADPLLVYLRKNAAVIKPDDIEAPLFNIREAFFVDHKNLEHISTVYKNIYTTLRLGKFIEQAPLNQDWTEALIFVTVEPGTATPTVSKYAMRLPKLQYLINMTPDDFFAFFQVLAGATDTSYHCSLKIDGMAYIPEIVAPFLVTNDTTWRLNPEFADTRWTNRSDIKFIAGFEPSTNNQLCALQYLNTKTNKNISYFPVDSAIQLEIDDWAQYNDDYCMPEGGATI